MLEIIEHEMVKLCKDCICLINELYDHDSIDEADYKEHISLKVRFLKSKGIDPEK